MKKYLLIAAGMLSLTLGILGIFLPLLPTTVFLLLAAFCFGRSSPRLHRWLMEHPRLGSRLKLYLNHKSVTGRTKAVSLITLWGSILFSVVVVEQIVVKAVLLCIAAAVSVHVLSLKTYQGEQRPQVEDEETKKPA